MKQLTCEMCGSTNLIKQDGVFVCQTCGTKYSVEEAKKMMIEGTVDVSGSTVKVDTSAELQNLYQVARRAKFDNNSEMAQKYYEMILTKDPQSWEAAFYSVYYAARNCKIGEIPSAAISVANCLDSVATLIKLNVPVEEQKEVYTEVLTNSAELAIDFINVSVKTSQNIYGSEITSAIKVINDSSFRNRISNSLQLIVVDAHVAATIFGDVILASDIYDKAYECLHSRPNRTYCIMFFEPIDDGKKEYAEKKRLYLKEAKKAYWEKHPEEKEALLSEKATLEEEIKNLENQKNELPIIKTVYQLERDISAAQREKDSLGLFKGKEKKALQEKIDDLSRRLDGATRQKQNELIGFDNKIRQNNKRIREINNELEG